MINLRFHMVSLVAVFFALAIGIAVGATVVDQGVLTQTESRLSSFDSKLQERDRSLSALRKELRQQKTLVEQLGPKAIAGRLEGRMFAVVAAGDVRVEVIRATARTLSSAGAEVVGTFRLDSTMDLNSAKDRRKARELLALPKVEGEGGLTGLRDALDARVGQSFAQPLLAPALGSLVDAGFVTVVGKTEPITLPSTVETVLLEHSVGPADVTIDDGIASTNQGASGVVSTTKETVAPSSTKEELASTNVGAAIGLRFVLAIRAVDAHRISVALSGKSLTDTVTSAIRFGVLRDAVTTVDGTETVSGASSLVFALVERPKADAAHFGVLRGARRRIAR